MLVLYIIIYLTIGLIIRLIGPIAKDLNRNVMENSWKKYFRIGWVSLGSPKPKLFDILKLEIVFSLLFIIFWPVGIILFIPHYITEKKEEKKTLEEYKQYQKLESLKGLTCARADGAGFIRCLDCKYEEYVTMSTHGIAEDGSYLSLDGFQCLTCGKFHTLRNFKPDEIYYCDCGEILSRDDTIFCPRCKNQNINYQKRFIT